VPIQDLTGLQSVAEISVASGKRCSEEKPDSTSYNAYKAPALAEGLHSVVGSRIDVASGYHAAQCNDGPETERAMPRNSTRNIFRFFLPT
jgi:hypothetical protein